MKRLQCEMCGSQDLVKECGVFVCQACGTKYSVEEAKKMMVGGTVSVEGTVAVEGTVKVDKSEELKNLLVLAQRAKDVNKNFLQASKYYGDIALKDPNSWEANFYQPYCKALYTKSLEDVVGLHKYFESTLKLVVENYGKGQEAKKILKLIINEIENIYSYIVGDIKDPASVILKLQMVLGLDLAIAIPEMKDIIANGFKACLNTYTKHCVRKEHDITIAGHDHITYEELQYVRDYEVAYNIKLILDYDPSFRDKWGFSDWIKNNTGEVFSNEDYSDKREEINDLFVQQAIKEAKTKKKKGMKSQEDKEFENYWRDQKMREMREYIGETLMPICVGGFCNAIGVGGIWGLIIESWAPVLWIGLITIVIVVILYVLKHHSVYN